MITIKVRVHRQWTAEFEDEAGRKAFHTDRSKRLHSLATALDLDVVDWGETDKQYPREIVEIIVALGSAGVFAAMVSAFNLWLDRDKVREIEIETANGAKLKLKGATAKDVATIAGEIN